MCIRAASVAFEAIESRPKACPYGRSVCLLGDFHPFFKWRSACMGRYEGEVHQIPRQGRFVQTAVGIGQKLFGNRAFFAERRYTQCFIDCPFKVDASLKDDFEFDGHVAHVQERTYAVSIGANVSRKVDGLTKNRAEGPVCDRLAERPETDPARAQKIDIAGFPILPERHRKQGAASEIAFGSDKKAGIHTLQCATDQSMVRPAILRH
jgi:hypothetical protein